MPNNRKPPGGHEHSSGSRPSPPTTRRDESDQKNASNADENPKTERKHPLEWLIFSFVVLTFLATATAAYYTRLQWKTAGDSEQRSLRAYVGITPGDYIGFGTDKHEFHMLRKNYGQTPAYDVGFVVQQVDITPMNAPIPNLAQKCLVAPPEGSLVTLFPQNELRFTFAAPSKLRDDQMNAVKLGAAQIVFAGTLCYRDAFGKHHWTNYCWIYKAGSTAAKDADYCLGGNDADRDE